MPIIPRQTYRPPSGAVLGNLEAVAHWTGLTLSTVHTYRDRGRLPPPVFDPGVQIWLRSDVMEWARERPDLQRRPVG